MSDVGSGVRDTRYDRRHGKFQRLNDNGNDNGNGDGDNDGDNDGDSGGNGNGNGNGNMGKLSCPPIPQAGSVWIPKPQWVELLPMYRDMNW